MCAKLAISNIVTVNVSMTPSGLNEPNINNLVLATKDVPIVSEYGSYGVYIDAASVGTDFGTSSETYALAANIFAQTPNLLSTAGSLYIMPTTAVSATAGLFKTVNIISSISAFELVTNGEFAIKRGDDAAINVSALDFSDVTTIDEIAAIIDAKLPAGYRCYGSDLVGDVNSKINIEAETVGTASSFTVIAVSGGTGTDLVGASYLNVSGGTTSVGVNSSGETVAEMLARADSLFQSVGFMTNVRLENTAIAAASLAIQSLDHIWMLPVDEFNYSAVGGAVVAASQSKTRCLYYSTFSDGLLFAAAYMGRAFSTNFAGASTCQTMHLKALTNVIADTAITQTTFTLIKAAGCDMYLNLGGISRTFSTGANKYFDDVYNMIALKFALQTDVFNLLATTSTKIPQTEAGMDSIKSIIVRVLELFVRNGYCAAGTWNSADTFGDPVTFKQNITEVGYYIYSLPISMQSQADREARKAPLVQVALKTAGAIHSVIINVLIEA